MTELRPYLLGTAASFRVELRRTLRDRRTMVLVFVMPVVIASIVVFALGSDDDATTFDIGWVATARGAAVDQFRQLVVQDDGIAGFVEWTQVASEDDARADVASGVLGAAIVVAPARTESGPADLRLIADEEPIASGVAATIIDEYRVGHASAVVAFERGIAPPVRGDTVSMQITAPRGASLDAAVHWGPAMGAFFILLGVGHAAHRQVDDRNRDITSRLRSTRTGHAPVLAGRALAATAIGGASLLVMAGATRVLFGRAWGPWPQIVAVAVATALAVAGVGVLIASLSRTTGTAQSLASLVAFGMAIGGGTFTPPGAGGATAGWEQWLPTALSLDAFGTATTTGHWGDLVVPVLVLVLTGAGLLAAGTGVARVVGS